MRCRERRVLTSNLGPEGASTNSSNHGPRKLVASLPRGGRSLREQLWFAVRRLPSVRRLQAVPILGRLMKAVSYRLLPSYSQCSLRVRSGPGKGLCLTLNPRWETALWQGTYESSVQRTLVNLLSPAKILYDVGGGIGFYSLLAARSGALALVFEPDVFNANCIRRNAEINGFSSQIRIFETAVFSETGRLALEPALQRTGHGNAHVLPNASDSRSLRLVPCTALDDFVDNQPAPDVIKIDIEGAESEAPKGAQKIFTRLRPQLICEVHDSANRGFIDRWAEKMDYTLHWLAGPGSFPVQVLGSPK